MDSEQSAEGVQGGVPDPCQVGPVVERKRKVESLGKRGSEKPDQQVVVSKQEGKTQDPSEAEQGFPLRMPQEDVHVEEGEQVDEVLFIDAPAGQKE